MSGYNHTPTEVDAEEVINADAAFYSALRTSDDFKSDEMELCDS